MGARLEVLSEQYCYRLLAGATMGRVGVSVAALPEVLPVNYALIDGDIVFRTGEGSMLHAASSDTAIAFEIDQSDPVTLSGWSVLVVGRSEEVTDSAEVARALAVLPDGWVPGERGHVVRMTPSRISGRRIERDGT